MHLKFHLQDASICGEDRHAQVVMKELGITYQHATPQSMGDSWWFWNCTNVPDILPKYLIELKIGDPMEYVGWGLSEDDAKKIINYEI